MIEKESYERVIEGLKMAADAAVHLAKHESLYGSVWTDIAAMLDKMRRQACMLAGIAFIGNERETQAARGNPYDWRKARDRFLDGIRQATGGMRQLATCFRGDVMWSFYAQQLERREKSFRALLAGKVVSIEVPRLVLAPGFTRQ